MRCMELRRRGDYNAWVNEDSSSCCQCHPQVAIRQVFARLAFVYCCALKRHLYVTTSVAKRRGWCELGRLRSTMILVAVPHRVWSNGQWGGHADHSLMSCCRYEWAAESYARQEHNPRTVRTTIVDNTDGRFFRQARGRNSPWLSQRKNNDSRQMLLSTTLLASRGCCIR